MSKARKIYDGTEVALVDSSGNLLVSLQTALPAGTNAIGKLAANSGVDIGDVDVASIAAGTNLIGKVSIDQVTANANEVVVKSITAGTSIVGSIGGLGILVPASVDLNAAITADVDAAVAADANLRLLGFSARESAGTPAIASGMLVNGATGAAAGKVAQIALAASGHQHEWYGPQGVACPLGISVDFIAGQFELCIYYSIVAVS